MRRSILIGAAVSTVAAGIGFVVGYRVAVLHLNDRYNEMMEEEIERTRIFNQKKYRTPEEAVKELINKQDAAAAVVDRSEVSTENLERIVRHLRYDQVKDGVAPEAEVPKNIFQSGSTGQDETFETEVENRDRTKPYVISDEENSENEHNHDQLVVTWYEGDNVLADDKDGVIEKVQRTIGLENLRFGHRSNDPNVVYIRNERLTADFTVLRHTGKYSVEVAGFDDEAGR